MIHEAAEFLSGVIEGFYGKPWTPSERVELFDWMARWGLNTYFYAPKDDLHHRALWREPYAAADASALAQAVAECSRRDIRFVYALGPGLDIRYADLTEIDRIRARFEQMLALGCEHFSLLFDDIPDHLASLDLARWGSLAAAQCHVANSVFEWVRGGVPRSRFIFCPTAYCGRMRERKLGGDGYLETIGRELSPAIDIFWTGPAIISREITAAHVEELQRVLNRKPLIWDNLNANDYEGRRFFCGPYSGRPPELRQIENRINEQILRNTSLREQVMGREEALSYGALAFFGDKYGERVRVVEVPGFSKEFCGGTHVHQTGDIGLFLFTAEQGISAGTRRVEALTGAAASEQARADQGVLEELEQAAKVDRRGLVDEYAKLREQLKAKDREIQSLKMKLATGAAAGSGAPGGGDLREIAGVQLWTPRFEGLDGKARAAVVDDYRNKNKDRVFALVSSAVDGEKVHVIAAVAPSLTDRIKAPEVMKWLGLRGGGRPDFAQGGGVGLEEVDAMRERAAETLKSMIEGK
jgi:hypothetical protein